MHPKYLILAILAVLGWSSSFAAIRASLFGGFDPGPLLLYRFSIASLLFLVYALYPKSNFKWPKLADLMRIFILGVIGITVYHVGVTFGQQTVNAGTAAMIIGTGPIFTTLIAMVILKEKIDKIGWIGLAFGFIGMAMIAFGATGAKLAFSNGIFLVLMAAIATSVFFVYQKPLFSKYHPIELTAYFTWAGTIPLLIFLPGLFKNLSHITLEANLAGIYVGVVPAALCYTLWAIALNKGKVSVVSNLIYLEPPLAIIIAWLWLGELPSIIAMVGGFITISSLIVVNFIGYRKLKRSGLIKEA